MSEQNAATSTVAPSPLSPLGGDPANPEPGPASAEAPITDRTTQPEAERPRRSPRPTGEHRAVKGDPAAASPGTTRKGPKRTGEKRAPGGRDGGTMPSSEELRGCVTTLADPGEKPHRRRSAWERLLAAGRRDWTSVAVALGEYHAADGPHDVDAVREWVLLELALDGDILERTKGGSVAAIAPTSMVALAVRVARSGWVSGKVTASVASVRSARRRELVPAPSEDVELNEHPLLQTDAQSSWPVPGEPRRGDSAPDIPTVGRWIGILASADVPLARELVARRELAMLRTGARVTDPVPAKELKIAKAVLEAVVRDAHVAFGPGAEAEEEFRFRSTLARWLGRGSLGWQAVDKARRTLVTAAPETATEAVRWAELVAMTDGGTQETLLAVPNVPDAALPALLASAERHRAARLRDAARDVAMQRAGRRSAGPSFWSGMLALREEMPDLARWLDGFVLKYAPMDLPSAGGDVGDGALLLNQTRKASFEEVRSAAFLERVARLEVGMRIPTLAVLAARLEAALPEAELQGREEIRRFVRDQLSLLTSREATLAEYLGASVPRLGEPLLRGAERLRKLLAEVDGDATVATATRAPAAAVTPSAEPALSDTVAALERLAFDSTQSADDQAALRAAVQRRLAWLATHEPASLEPVVASASTLPPEAMGAVWEVGVQRRVPALLETLGAFVGAAPWAERVLLDVLVSSAMHGDGPLALPPAVADRTARALEERVHALEGRLADGDPTGVRARIRSQARETTVGALRELAGAIQTLAGFAGAPPED